MKNSTLNKWKSAYEKREINPSGDLWDQLELKMDEPNLVPEHHKTPAYRWAGAAAVILLLSIGSILYFVRHKERPDRSQSTLAIQKNLKTEEVPFDTGSGDQDHNQDQLPETEATGQQKFAETTGRQKKQTGRGVPESGTTQNVSGSQPELPAGEITVSVPVNAGSVSSPQLHDAEETIMMADMKKQNPEYIHADELLLGREIDKLNGSMEHEKRKFGVFNLKRVVPKVEKVTVLGVKVYIDSK